MQKQPTEDNLCFLDMSSNLSESRNVAIEVWQLFSKQELGHD